MTARYPEIPYGMTPTEAQLYAAIVNADGRVVPVRDLVRAIGYQPTFDYSDSTLIRRHIFNLRGKVGRDVIGSGHGMGGYYWREGRFHEPSIPPAVSLRAWQWVDAQRAATL